MLNMVKDGYLRKEGAARSTIYIKNTEERSCSMDTEKVITVNGSSADLS